MRPKFLIKTLPGLFIALLLPIAQPTLQSVSASPMQQVTTKSRPGRATVYRIVTKQQSRKSASVTVYFYEASTHPSSPIQFNEVKIGSRTCRPAKNKNFCSIAGFSLTTNVSVRVRAKNRNGFGPWSKSVSYRVLNGFVWRPTSESDSPGTTSPAVTAPASSVPGSGGIVALPGPRTDLAKSRVIGVTAVKLEKIEGISAAVSSTSFKDPDAVRKNAAGDVVFRTSGTVAFAQAPSASRVGSELLAVSSAGSLSDALISGSAVVKEFFTAPSGDLFVVFQSKVSLTPGSNPCLLASVSIATGVPTCVDGSLDSIEWPPNPFVSGYKNSPVQFDSSGNIFYVGRSGQALVLRKAKNGIITDLINDNVTVRDFLVQPDGTLFVIGGTSSTNSYWVRRFSPNGALKNIAIGYSNSLLRFSDGEVYVGMSGNDQFGIRKYEASLEGFDEMYWVTGCCVGSGNRIGRFIVNGSGTIPDCSQQGPVNYYTKNVAFCGAMGTNVAALFNVLSTRTFGVAAGGPSKQLWQYYPTVEKANVTRIAAITGAQQVITNIILSGTDSSGVNLLSVYDTSSKQETVVLDGSNEVEVYSFSYSVRRNSVMFTGLRFSDNKYVVGEVSL